MSEQSKEVIKPLRLGFIGGALNSAVGYTHFNASRLDGHFRVDAGCFSRDPAQNSLTATSYQVDPERVHPNWQEMLAKEKNNLDAVLVLTPTPSHADIVVAALEAGYPVICEKALAGTSEECHRIVVTTRKNRGLLAVTYNYSGYPMVRQLKEMIRRGELGQLQQIHIEMPQEGFLRKGASPQDWRLQDGKVPTVSLDLGVHVHHLVHFLSGGKRPLNVVGDQMTYGQFGQITDNVYCLARYENDMRVQAWWGKTALGYRNGLRVRVFGSKASAEWYQMSPEDLLISDNEGHQLRMDRGSGEADIARQQRYNRFKAGHPSGFIEAFSNLYADIASNIRLYQSCTAGSDEYVYGAQDSYEGLRFIESIAESSSCAQWVTVQNLHE